MTSEEKKKFAQEQFVRVPVYRGFTEIEMLTELVWEAEGQLLGGYIRWMCSPQSNPSPASDIDVYCPNLDVFESLKETLKKAEFEIKRENEISISYLRPKHPHVYFSCPTIQLIKPMREGVIVTEGDMESILKNFDFTVVRIGLDLPDSALADPDFVEDERDHRLRIKNIHCPISSMYRVMKYKSKGYFPSTGLILKLFLDWEERPESTKLKILAFYKKLEEDEKSVTEEEIEEMERLMRLVD